MELVIGLSFAPNQVKNEFMSCEEYTPVLDSDSDKIPLHYTVHQSVRIVPYKPLYVDNL